VKLLLSGSLDEEMDEIEDGEIVDEEEEREEAGEVNETEDNRTIDGEDGEFEEGEIVEEEEDTAIASDGATLTLTRIKSPRSVSSRQSRTCSVLYEDEEITDGENKDGDQIVPTRSGKLVPYPDSNDSDSSNTIINPDNPVI